MSDKQNRFYSSISKYYSEIFPYNPAQLHYIERQAGSLSGKKIIDAGCATGELAYALAKKGAEVSGLDVNDDLLNTARATKSHPGLTFFKKDMLEIPDYFPHNQFDVVLCFGNTLVHLPSLEQIGRMLKDVKTVLKPGGLLLLQILNYDYILDENITELPVIDTANIRFIRRYAFQKNDQQIKFITKLRLKKEGKTIENETDLLALKSNELNKLLLDAGYGDTAFYAGFNEAPYGGNHMPLVVKAVNP